MAVLHQQVAEVEQLLVTQTLTQPQIQVLVVAVLHKIAIQAATAAQELL
jgi:hypothetical protein